MEKYITAFRITPVSTHDKGGLRNIVETQPNLVVIGDKGYVGKRPMQEIAEKGICLMALKRSSSKTDLSESVRQLIFKLRRRVETPFLLSSEQLNAERYALCL